MQSTIIIGEYHNKEDEPLKKILIIEDDTDINNLMAECLRKAGYACTQAFSGTEGLLHAQHEPFDLIILDLMLPGLDGEAVLPQIRKEQTAPVIVVSAKDSLDSKVELLTAGADDYITKPFEVQEFLARVGVQLRRTGGVEARPRTLRHHDLVLNESTYTAAVSGTELPLTRQEFKILELLLSHPDQVFSKQDIYDYAWDDMYIGEDKTINVHISNIRKKLKAVSDREYIETVWGIGFKLAK